MPGSTFLAGDRITLETIERTDLEWMRDLWNHRQIRIFGGGPPGPFNAESMEGYYEAFVCDGDATHLAICAGGSPVGVISLDPADPRTRNAELGYLVSPDHHRKGYATEACELLLDHAFDQLGLHKVHATTFSFNEPSIGLLEKLGFRREGVLRDERFADGEYADVHYFGVLADERERHRKRKP